MISGATYIFYIEALLDTRNCDFLKLLPIFLRSGNFTQIHNLNFYLLFFKECHLQPFWMFLLDFSYIQQPWSEDARNFKSLAVPSLKNLKFLKMSNSTYNIWWKHSCFIHFNLVVLKYNLRCKTVLKPFFLRVPF